MGVSALDVLGALSQHPATTPVLIVALVASWGRVLVIRVRERRAEREHLATLSAMLPPPPDPTRAPRRADKILVTQPERTRRHAAA